MLRKLSIATLLLLAPVSAQAETWAQLKARLTRGLMSHDPKNVQLVVDYALTMPLYDLAATLTAASETDGKIAYALDTDVFYFRMNAAWDNYLSAAGVLTLKNAGTISNATDSAFIFGENSEDAKLAFTSNLGTWSSSTGATFAFTPAVGFTDDVTFSGGASAAIFSGSAASIIVDDNDTTALLIGSTGQLNLLTIDSGDDTETVIVTGTTATTAFHVDVGESLFDEGANIAIAATALEVIRFCGNGSATGVAHYIGPVLLDDTEADLAFGGAGCDALDNATEGTADAPWHAAFAFKPVAMACVGVCTGASAANDAITYQLRDDTASVTGMACTAPAWTGDANPQQCTVRDASPATVAANSSIAILTTGTDDACGDAGDDFECLVYITF